MGGLMALIPASEVDTDGWARLSFDAAAPSIASIAAWVRVKFQDRLEFHKRSQKNHKFGVHEFDPFPHGFPSLASLCLIDSWQIGPYLFWHRWGLSENHESSSGRLWDCRNITEWLPHLLVHVSQLVANEVLVPRSIKESGELRKFLPEFLKEFAARLRCPVDKTSEHFRYFRQPFWFLDDPRAHCFFSQRLT
jgi:hypothetical protein